jgi:hypothetical protein
VDKKSTLSVERLCDIEFNELFDLAGGQLRGKAC